LLLAKRAKEDFMAMLQLVDEKLGVIVENVKIDKTIFVDKYTPKKWLHLIEECH